MTGTTTPFITLESLSNPPKNDGKPKFYLDSLSGNLILQRPDGTRVQYTGTAVGTNTGGSSGQGGGGTTTTPPNTTAPTAVYQDGSTTFDAVGTTIAPFNTTSPISNTSGTVAVVASKYEFNFTGTNGKMGLETDLTTATLTRNFRCRLKIDSTASISAEKTWAHFYTYQYAKGLVQIRILPGISANSKFRFKLYTGFDALGVPQASKGSNMELDKGTDYDIELYITDFSISLVNKTTGKIIIRWYSSQTGANFDNTNQYIGGVNFGEFYSGNMTGKLYISNIKFLQDYIYPTIPGSLASKVQLSWQGYKNTYLRSDGAIVRPLPEGVDGLYAPYTDVVSEGPAYALVFAVQLNDVTAFDAVEQWCYTYLDRRNASQTSGSAVGGLNLMGWHWNEITGTTYDTNWATDADIDRAMALIWAAKRKAANNAGWVSSSINYGARATAIINDLKTKNLRAIGTKQYFTSDAFQGSNNPFETNPSYVSVAAMKIFRDFTGDTTWDAAINGAYEMFTNLGNATLKNSNKNGASEVGVGLPPDWGFFDSPSGAVNANANNSGRLSTFTYDAFRTIQRVYWHKHLFNNTQATTYLSGKVYDFYKSQWDNSASINAEYSHDGAINVVNAKANTYEKTMMTFNAYFVFKAQGDTTRAPAIYNAKLKDSLTYCQHPHGDFFRDNAANAGKYQGAPSYFNESWVLFAYLIESGQFINYI
jgi:endo-1,4-beta-D-glucanase Y